MSALTPHEMGSSDDESEGAVEPVEEASLGKLALDLWNSRSKKLHHDYAIAGWALSVSQEVRDHVSQNMLPEHREAIERVVCHLHVIPCPNKAPRLLVLILMKGLICFGMSSNVLKRRQSLLTMLQGGILKMLLKASHICGMKNTHYLTPVFLVLLLVKSPPRPLGLGHVNATGHQ